MCVLFQINYIVCIEQGFQQGVQMGIMFRYFVFNFSLCLRFTLLIQTINFPICMYVQVFLIHVQVSHLCVSSKFSFKFLVCMFKLCYCLCLSSNMRFNYSSRFQCMCRHGCGCGSLDFNNIGLVITIVNNIKFSTIASWQTK